MNQGVANPTKEKLNALVVCLRNQILSKDILSPGKIKLIAPA
jgi:hypothetical protein